MVKDIVQASDYAVKFKSLITFKNGMGELKNVIETIRVHACSRFCFMKYMYLCVFWAVE